MPATELQLPEPISKERIAQLVGRSVDPDIASIDLEMVKTKMAEPKEAIGWSLEQLEEAELEYKRYLVLCRRYPYPKHSIVPNKVMDMMWHYHILDTRAYCADCDRVFGHYFHHFPYFGLRGEDDAQNLKNAFEKTKNFYEITFGESMVRAEANDCWHDCSNRCWHACSDE
jgi:Glycine-rich domain-containing protein-like